MNFEPTWAKIIGSLFFFIISLMTLGDTVGAGFQPGWLGLLVSLGIAGVIYVCCSFVESLFRNSP